MANLATSAVKTWKGSLYCGGPVPYALMKKQNPQATEKHIQRCDKAVKNTVKAAALLNMNTLIIAEIRHKGGAQKQFNEGVNALKSIFSK